MKKKTPTDSEAELRAKIEQLIERLRSDAREPAGPEADGDRAPMPAVAIRGGHPRLRLGEVRPDFQDFELLGFRDENGQHS